jgi:hypothetical protein
VVFQWLRERTARRPAGSAAERRGGEQAGEAAGTVQPGS